MESDFAPDAARLQIASRWHVQPRPQLCRRNSLLPLPMIPFRCAARHFSNMASVTSTSPFTKAVVTSMRKLLVFQTRASFPAAAN